MADDKYVVFDFHPARHDQPQAVLLYGHDLDRQTGEQLFRQHPESWFCSHAMFRKTLGIGPEHYAKEA